MHRPIERQIENKDRRNFLRLAGLAAAGGAIGLNAACQPTIKKAPSIDHTLTEKSFWKRVQGQFALDPDQVYMNIGTTGAMPIRVLDNYDQYNRVVARHPMGFTDELGWEFGFIKQREQLSRQFGCTKDEIIITRNTTDGLNTVLFGLPFERGDEILITHHEHVSALSPLHVLQDRFGVVLKEVEIPVLDLEYGEQVIEAFKKNITLKSRAILFSHIPYKTGVRLPATAICKLAREKGLISIVDGAHCAGMIELDFSKTGCDFYAASGHKWQCGPGATGILYLRNHGENIPMLWPQNSCLYQYVSQPVNNDRKQIRDFSSQFGLRGQENYPAMQAMLDACDLWEEIGRDRIEGYICGLSSYLKKRIKESFGSSALLFSPDIPELTSGLTAFNPFKDVHDQKNIEDFVDRLKREMGYVIRSTEFHLHKEDTKNTYALRISTHLFHNEAQVDGVVDAMHRLYKKM
ncbi:MAG: aminotransferase class V-fold PLP-dependent enzyme [Desulfatiglans sp.]|jgi:selenocysteine lyase/cysteine desulfurase|nr:aminotransferase class V-fold PLP-dependent enzyme [Desulfatiglans sp.]